MRVTFQYRLRPTKNQSTQMEAWLDLLRRQYNYRLWERFNWWDSNRCPLNACPLVCSIAPPAKAPEYYCQKRDLVQTKAKYPEDGDIYSTVLQDCIARVKKTFDRFVKGSQSRARVLCVEETGVEFITLPKIGKVKMILHRPLPDGFIIKTCTVIRKPDGWYVTLSLQDDTVPTLSPDINIEKIVGIDVGLKEFLVTNQGEVVPIPQFARKSEKRRKTLNKALSRKQKKGTRRRQKAGKSLSKHYQKVARQREDFHLKVAKQLLSKHDVIAHEDLNIKGLAKTRLSKSILDAGWGEFIGIVAVKAERAGLLTVAVNPSGTTQNCSSCGEKVPKTLKDRWHSCPHCGLELDRDLNAAINIKHRAEGHPVLKAQRLLCNSRIG